jgi:hypothetical protein
VFVAVKEQQRDDADSGTPPRRLFLRCKSNIGADSDGFEFNLEQQALEGCEDMFASAATLGQALQGNTRTILTDAETEPGDGDGGAFDEAKEWLLDFLVGGPHAVKEVFKAVGEAGRAQKILRRAKSSLGVLARKSSLRGGWEWFYPGAMNEGGQGGQENPKMPTLCGEGALGKSGHLRAEDGFSEVEI